MTCPSESGTTFDFSTAICCVLRVLAGGRGGEFGAHRSSRPKNVPRELAGLSACGFCGALHCFATGGEHMAAGTASLPGRALCSVRGETFSGSRAVIFGFERLPPGDEPGPWTQRPCAALLQQTPKPPKQLGVLGLGACGRAHLDRRGESRHVRPGRAGRTDPHQVFIWRRHRLPALGRPRCELSIFARRAARRAR